MLRALKLSRCMQIGPLMRDVKNVVCQTLDMAGLLEDDFGMELLVCVCVSLSFTDALLFMAWPWENEHACFLSVESQVAGRIINLSLPISAVYERIWRANLDAGRRGVGTSGRTAAVSSSNVGGPPMLVTYRLQGLDGEATEPMVSELEEVAGHEADPQEEYAVAAVLAEELTTVQGFAEPSCSIALLLHQLAMLPAQVGTSGFSSASGICLLRSMGHGH